MSILRITLQILPATLEILHIKFQILQLTLQILHTSLFALSGNFYLTLFILALSGAFDNVSVVIRSTIVQLFTPDKMRGRVSSVSTMFISSSNEIGAFESGLAARLLGLVPSVIFGGGVALLAVGGAAVWLPKLRTLQLNAKEEKAEAH